jgi:hypothetical protein
MKVTGALFASFAACGCLSAGLWLGSWITADAAEATAPAVIDVSEYPNLQAAFDALPESGGLIRLPPGKFEVTRPLLLSRGDTRMEGAGAATHLINRNEQGQPALIIRHHNRPAQRGRIWRVQLANFRISGNPKSGDGVLAEGVNEIYIHGLSVDHNGGHGISLIDCYEDPRVADSILTYNGKAGLNLIQNHDIVVNGNQFEENQDGVRSIDSYNLCMNGNNLDDHLRHGVVIENTCCSVVAGNMIEEGKGTGIVVDRDSYGITLGSNVIVSNYGGGVDLRDGWGVSVSSNTFSLMPRPALVIRSGSGRITVTGNNFSNSYIGGRSRRKENFTMPPPRTSSYATGILLEGAEDVAISGNVFAGLIREAVKTQGDCRRIALAGNVTSDLGRMRSEQLPAFDLRGARELLVGHNLFEKGFEPKPAQ